MIRKRIGKLTNLPPKKAVATDEDAFGFDQDRSYPGGLPSEQTSLIERKREALLQALENGAPAATVTVDLTNILLQAIIDILPSLERNAKASSKNVYHLEKMATLARDLQHDLRNMEDRNAMRDKIMGDVIDPELLSFANQNITDLNKLVRLLRNNPEAQDFVDRLRHRTAVTVNSLHSKVANALDAYFGGDKNAQNIMSENTSEDDEDDIYGEPDDADELAAKAKGTRRK